MQMNKIKLPEPSSSYFMRKPKMIKNQYIKVQKEILKTIPVNPFELTDVGIRHLKNSILVSLISLPVCLVMSLVTFRWALSPEGTATEGLMAMFVKLAGLLIILFGSLFAMSKSTDYLLGTGLYWQLSVSDELQDEWALTQKRRSYSKAFEYVIYGAAAIFVLVLAYCGIAYAFTGALPPPPSFGVSVIIAGSLIYVSALAPIINIAWTLAPIEDDGSYVERVKPLKRERTEPLKPKQTWMKRLWQWGPIVLGLLVGVSWAVNQ